MRSRGAFVAVLVALSLAVPLLPSDAAPSRLAIKGSTVKEFGTRFEKTLAGVLDALIPRLDRIAPEQGARERLLSFSMKAGGGTVDVQGLGLLLPKPRRYDLTLDLHNVREPKSSSGLSVNGTLEFDFIKHGSDLADGLFRGVMRLGGRFKGNPEVHGEVINGDIIAMVVESGGHSFRTGKRKPRDFVTYAGTLAGKPEEGFSDGTGSAARFNEPEGLGVAEDGTVYVADTENDAVRKITPTGRVTTLATGLAEPTDIGFDPDGNLIVAQRCTTECDADSPPQQVPLSRMDPDTGEVTPIVFNRNEAKEDICGQIIGHCDGRSPMGTMNWPDGIDVQGNIVYVAQSQYWPSIRMVLPDGYVTTLRYSSAGGRDGGDCGDAGILGGNSDVAKGKNGELYYLISAVGCYGVLVLEPDGSVHTLAGNLGEFGNDDGVGTNARFFFPTDLAFDGVRYLYVGDSTNNLIRRVDVNTRRVVRIAGCLDHTPGFDCVSAQVLRDGNGDRAQFYLPEGLALDQWGDLYIADRRNHAVRVLRIVNDPGREPTIDGFQPFAVERGTSRTIEVKGLNLGLADSASLGEGVSIDLQNAGSKRVILHATIDPNATPGPRTLTIHTPYGTAESPPGLSLEILDAGSSGANVTTIAGTGSWLPGLHDGPAEKSEIGFAAGMELLDDERILLADTIEQRVRLIATKKGATDDVVELMLHASVERETLDPILNGLAKLGEILSALGIENKLDNATEASLNPIVSQAIDEWCNALDGDCRWLSLPWAGVPMSPGDSNGIRLQGRLYLPSDVAVQGAGIAYIADSGNSKLKSVGWDPGPNPGVEAPMQIFDTNRLNDRPYTVAAKGDNVALAGLATSSYIENVAMQSSGDETVFAGVEDGVRCIQAPDDPRQPFGVPLGMDVTPDATFIADAYCQTIWRIDKETGDVTDMRGNARQDGTDVGRCSDGPASFATFGAPVDVSVDPNGNIWVADSACNSIRVMTDLNKDEPTIAAELKDYLNGVAGHLPGPVADAIGTKLDELDGEFLATNRWWVLTVAGNDEGKAGFEDGSGADALFDYPLSLEAIHKDGKAIVYVSDTGNHRVRRIESPQI